MRVQKLRGTKYLHMQLQINLVFHMQWLHGNCFVRSAPGDNNKTAIITVKRTGRLITTLIEKQE